MLQSTERRRCVEAHQVQGSAQLLRPDRPGSRGAIRRRGCWQAARKHYPELLHSQWSVHAGRAPALAYLCPYACGKWPGTSSRRAPIYRELFLTHKEVYCYGYCEAANLSGDSTAVAPIFRRDASSFQASLDVAQP